MSIATDSCLYIVLFETLLREREGQYDTGRSQYGLANIRHHREHGTIERITRNNKMFDFSRVMTNMKSTPNNLGAFPCAWSFLLIHIQQVKVVCVIFKRNQTIESRAMKKGHLLP